MLRSWPDISTSSQPRGEIRAARTQADAERWLAVRLLSLRWPRGHRLLPRGLAFCGDLPRDRASCLSRPVHGLRSRIAPRPPAPRFSKAVGHFLLIYRQRGGAGR